MNCKQVVSEMFYLAEDDVQIDRLLQEHLSSCKSCNGEWLHYKQIVTACDQLIEPYTPELVLHKSEHLHWRWVRVAAAVLLTFAILKWNQPVATVRKSKIYSWDPPASPQRKFQLSGIDPEFDRRVQRVSETIRKLQNETSLNKF